MRSLVVIPTYNEHENVSALVSSIQKALKCELLFIDDNSPDGTGAHLDELAIQNKSIHVIHRERKIGLGSAYREGFLWALREEYDPIIQMDGDGSHDPKYLQKFLQLSEWYELIIGSRYSTGGGTDVQWSWFRKFLSWAGNHYVNTILFLKDNRYRIHDSTGGFKCWRASTLTKIDMATIQSDGYAFQIEMNWRAVGTGARIIETPIIFHDRTQGKSKLARSGIVQTALLPWQLKK